MKRAFVFEKVAVVVQPWWEPMDPPERGARVEVRLVPEEPHRGSRFASQPVVADVPVFRADLFDQVDAPPGNLRSAHFHPRFNGIEPCERVWKDEIKADPIGWLSGELTDLEALVERGGHGDAGKEDADAVRDAIPDIVAAVDATWAAVRRGDG